MSRLCRGTLTPGHLPTCRPTNSPSSQCPHPAGGISCKSYPLLTYLRNPNFDFNHCHRDLIRDFPHAVEFNPLARCCGKVTGTPNAGSPDGLARNFSYGDIVVANSESSIIQGAGQRGQIAVLLRPITLVLEFFIDGKVSAGRRKVRKPPNRIGRCEPGTYAYGVEGLSILTRLPSRQGRFSVRDKRKTTGVVQISGTEREAHWELGLMERWSE
ncbi:hypothetical protein K438DRAFT_1756869 [Mycena galopus ATCC 62051]|nr:hypothetical protein K438DRAFT_1756869 [Mycena galopus ATCC 62051]